MKDDMENEYKLTDAHFECSSDFKDYREISKLLKDNLDPMSSFLFGKILRVLEEELINTVNAMGRFYGLYHDALKKIKRIEENTGKPNEPN